MSLVLLVIPSFLGTYLNPSKHKKVMKEKKKHKKDIQ
jgi:hypothetical protein